MGDIVKVQLPLFTSDGSNDALIYNKTGHRQEIRALTDAETKMMKGAKKAYFNADWQDGSWTLTERTMQQEW